MWDSFRKLFETDLFMPHGHCYLWDRNVIWLHVVSDSLIALAYYSIPLALIYMVRKKKDLPYRWMFVMFGCFIVACGTTHAMAVYTVWHPVYWLDGVIKAGTAILSVATAILLVPLIPKALSLRSAAELEASNRELQISNKELNQFAHVVSHDLQEPLRMVRSYSQLLAQKYKGRLDSDADEYIRFTVEGAAHMQELINDLLSYAEVGNANRPLEEIDCEAVLATVLANLKASINNTHAIVTHAPLPRIFANPTELLQLFQNLISNAIKFHGDKPPSVHVSAERKQDTWVFSVRDYGIGIDPQYFDRIFVIFQRLHTKSEYPGTGIGLAICKRILERRGGEIHVESTPGLGSTFFFSIPHPEKSAK